MDIDDEAEEAPPLVGLTGPAHTAFLHSSARATLFLVFFTSFNGV